MREFSSESSDEVDRAIYEDVDDDSDALSLTSAIDKAFNEKDQL